MTSRPARHIAAACVAAMMLSPAAIPAAAQPLPGTTCSLFPADSIFNADVSALPVNAQSTTWMSNMTQNSNLHPDVGTFAQQYGIPINVAPPPTSGVTPTFLYDSESDHPVEGYPIDQNTLIEGGPGAPSGSDRHALVVNSNLCKLYEIYNLQNFTNGQQPQAGSGAVWDLSSDAMRPNGWTSADAAGLPMTPLLLRPDEIVAGSITHAIRFTAHCTNSYIWPGSHNAGSCSTGFPPMGARFRLRAGFDISGFSPNTQVVLRAFQHYGLILADNGSDWFFGGTTDNWWGTPAGDTVVSELKTIPAAQFDAVDESGLQAAAGSYRATGGGPVTPPTAYTAVTPVRLMDTRIAGGPLGPQGFRNLTVAGVSLGAPAGATAVVVNVTVTNTTSPSYLTVFPAGAAQPLASNLNFLAGTTIPNLVSVQVGVGGAITFFNAAGSTDVVVDLQGYYAAPSGSAGGEVALPPARITDTRAGSGLPNAGRTLGQGGSLNVHVTGAGGVPAIGVSAAILNVTVTNTTAPSWLVAWPAGATRPLASNLDWTAGVTIPNRVFVPIGSGGQISVYNSFGSADVIIDVSGYFTDSSATGKLFSSQAPIRLADTRNSGQTLGPGGRLTIQVGGIAGVPSSATAVVLNVTVTNTTAPSWLVVYPSTGSRPLASDLDWVGGRTIPNLVVATVGSTGAITIFNSAGSTDVIVDLGGWYG